MLSQKELSIVNYLSQHRDRFVTSKELAEHLSCSDRTARTYLKSLMTYPSEQTGASLIAKQGYGYQYAIHDEERHLNFICQHQNKQRKDPIDLNDRHNYILNKLIFEQDKVFFDDLMDQLYVSRSTLSSDFKKIRKDLISYDLTVENRPHKGVYVEGSEHDKRRFIMDYFFSGHFLKNLHQYVDDDFFKLPISFEELTIVVLDECRSEDLKLSDFVIQNLVVHIALALKRVKDGFEIAPIDIDRQKFQKEVMVADRILDRIAKITAIILPETEANYIALHLISKAIDKESSGLEKSAQLIRQELLKAFAKLDQHNGYHFSDDFTLIEGLVIHLEVLAERLKNDIRLDNPLLEEIKTNYGDAMELTSQVMSDLPIFSAYELSDDEIAYVALHLMAALERHKEENKLNVLVICATGYGSAQMLKNRLTNELSPYLNIVDLIGYYDINDDKLQGIDLIISSIDLSNLVFTVPVFTVSVFLKDEEVAMIKKEIAHLGSSGTKLKEAIEELDLEQVFDHYFSENDFYIYDTIEKQELLEEMITGFNQANNPDYSKSMLDLIQQRERMSTVIFNDLIAVPHPIKAVDGSHRIAVALVKQGLGWDQDFKEVKLVFLVSPSIAENEGLPLIIKRIVDLTENDAKTQALLEANDFAQFKKEFLKDHKKG